MDLTEISIFSRKKANVMENVTAVKSWIKLVPSDQRQGHGEFGVWT